LIWAGRKGRTTGQNSAKTAQNTTLNNPRNSKRQIQTNALTKGGGSLSRTQFGKDQISCNA